MNFRTEITLNRGRFDVDYAKKGFMAGSCFAENIAAKLKDSKFIVVSNPFGVLFNPASVADMINVLNSEREFRHEDLCYDGELWFSWAHHGDFSDCDADVVLRRINNAVRDGAKALRNSDYVVLTFGTSWVYELASAGMIVANCHKMPSETFSRRRLGVGEIVALFEPLLRQGGLLSDKRVVFTISPIRHLKDGFQENSLSKAVLRVAIGELTDMYNNTEYFPSYEILNDDLRDYRFYAEDMAHPSVMAVEYVWEKFCDVYMSDTTRSYMHRIEKISTAMRHRIIRPDSVACEKFINSQYLSTLALSRELPYVDFSRELDYFGTKR